MCPTLASLASIVLAVARLTAQRAAASFVLVTGVGILLSMAKAWLRLMPAFPEQQRPGLADFPKPSVPKKTVLRHHLKIRRPVRGTDRNRRSKRIRSPWIRAKVWSMAAASCSERLGGQDH